MYGPVVINLDRRLDRLSQVTDEFKRLDLTFSRLAATDRPEDPAMACHDSHCRALENFLKSESQIGFICEDDVKFLCTRSELDNYVKAFTESTRAEVLCLGNSSRAGFPHFKPFYRTTDNQTRTAYIVKRKIAAELLDLWRRLYILRISGSHKNEPNWYSSAFSKLPLQTTPKDIYRGDQAWKILQQSHTFVIPNAKVAIQRPSYSDIEKCYVDYFSEKK